MVFGFHHIHLDLILAPGKLKEYLIPWISFSNDQLVVRLANYIASLVGQSMWAFRWEASSSQQIFTVTGGLLDKCSVR